MINYPQKIDLHMHTLVSDGTDSPIEITDRVKSAGIDFFSVTDHDAFKACKIIKSLLKTGDPEFVTGIEFSCKDEDGQYHILGYGYDMNAVSVQNAVDEGHMFRVNKLKERLDFLKKAFGFDFDEKDITAVYSVDNPGKPHLANLMVKYGYAASIDDAIRNYINKLRTGDDYIRPENAIKAVLEAGGIPVLAHPSFGRGDELIVGEDMDRRLKKLIGFGIRGVEAFYSGFTFQLQSEMLLFANRYGLYVTAGSDYHGKNKKISLGDTNLTDAYPAELKRFLDDVRKD